MSVAATKRRPSRAIGLALAGAAAIAAAVGYVRLRPQEVAVTRVVRGKAMDAIYATGTVEAEERVFVRAKAGGSVAELLVKEGARVRRGDRLARIDNPTATFDLKRGEADRGAASAMAAVDSPQIGARRAQADAIQADLTIARQELSRAEQLAASGSIASAEEDRARSRVAQIEASFAANEAQLRALRIDLSANAARQSAQVMSLASRVADTEVRSPIDGVVLSRAIALGEVVTVNQPLFKIGDTTSLVLEVSVDEADVARVHDGLEEGTEPSEVAVSLYAFPGRALRGSVFEVMPDANRERKAFLTKVRLKDPPRGMRSGMSAEVNIIASRRDDVLLVPTQAEADGFVWIVDGGRAARRAVTTGTRDLLRVEIVSGVAEGEMVAVEAPPGLREGARVSAAYREPSKYEPLPDRTQPVQTAIK